jgi:hypothetical protein
VGRDAGRRLEVGGAWWAEVGGFCYLLPLTKEIIIIIYTIQYIYLLYLYKGKFWQ